MENREVSLQRIKSGRISRKLKRSLKRRIRRKRDKLRYYKTLNSSRKRRESDDLCASIVEINITGMEWRPASSDPMTDVSDWHNFGKVAYWKSRALALEMENKMLHQHLRNVYAKQVQDYVEWKRMQEEEKQSEKKHDEDKAPAHGEDSRGDEATSTASASTLKLD